MNDPVVILSAQRTPIGSFQGQFSSVSAPQLGAVAIEAAIAKAGIRPEQVDEVIMGCVLSAGLGQAPARQAALNGGLPYATACTTVNKMCGSGMQSIILGHDMIRAGSADIVVAGGMESMTNVPYLINKARSGLRMGDNHLLDHMFFDGLEDAYEKDRVMGSFAEEAAEQYKLDRAQQDAYAQQSLIKAREAISQGLFADEIVPVTVKSKRGDVVVDSDEQPFVANPDKLSQLKATFKKDGTITAGSSSSISDGASAVVLCRASLAKQLGLSPKAEIIGHARHAQAPGLFTSAPVGAINKVLELSQWSADSVDSFEINEAFAVVTMIAIQQCKLERERVNRYGGACALGHPVGASGARIVTTLLNVLNQHQQTRGVASLCIGGGEATALAVALCAN